MLLRPATTLLLSVFVAAQGEPAPDTVRVRVVGQVDGLPRPGALLYVRTREVPRNVVNAAGFFVHEAPEITRLRAARAVRTDPTGEAVLPAVVERQIWMVFAGEPYSLAGRPEVVGAGTLVWEVFEREPVGVRVVDQERRPVAGFPVALHAGGRDLSYALTDHEGRAVLGMPPGHTARLCLAPAGWVGSHEGMPTIATVLPGRRGAELVLPPHGTLRLCAVRGGEPVRVRLGSFALRLPGEPRWLANGAANGEVHAFGFEVPRVALGIGLSGSVHLLVDHPLEITGPEQPGTLRTIDCELPWQPELRAKVVGPVAAAAFPPTPVRIALHTDAGRVEDSAALHRDGRLEFPGPPRLRGKRLLRIDLDLPASDPAQPRAWWASHRCDHDLGAAMLDLGTLALASTAPLHGRVVDAHGRPVADAQVLAEPQATGQGFLLPTDRDGHFAWRMPLPRDQDGEPLAIRASARRGDERSEAATFVPGAEALTLTLSAAATAAAAAQRQQARPARRAAGTVTVVLADAGQAPEVAGSLSLAAGTGFAVYPAESVPGPGGMLRVTFTGLQAGSYALLGRDQRHQTRLLLHRLEVPDQGACSDPRLARVSLAQGLVVRTLQVVDGQGVPIAGATVRGTGFHRQTDGTGSVLLATHDPSPMPARIEAMGRRPVEIADFADGLVVAPPLAGTLRVRIRGLPAGLPRERIGVWVRHQQRERLEGPRASIDAQGVATVPTPVAGNYVLWLLVYPQGQGQGQGERLSGRGIGIRQDPVPIGEDPPAEIEWQLDAATIARLQTELGAR